MANGNGPMRLDASAPDFEDAFTALLSSKRETDADFTASVDKIVDAVAEEGDAALFRFTEQFDRLALTGATVAVTAAEIAAAEASIDRETRAALDLAAARIEAFHARQMPEDFSYTDDAGVGLGLRWTAVQRVGLYVPGGQAAYPSSVLMNALPAKVAGVRDVVMCVPAPDGRLNPLVLTAAKVAGVDRIFKVGGAQAVAAMAHGTASIPAVDKIVGPGNAYVAAAKRKVFGKVGIDSIAGPSEVLVVADADNDPDWVAIDLLSQAEHDADAQAILITDDAAFAVSVAKAVDGQLATLPRRDVAGESWRRHGHIIVVPDLDAAVPLVDRLAPEHLELAVADPEALMAKITNAGAIFLGRYTPEAVGDYVGGPNHVLPTARTARFDSGLSVFDFLKRTTTVACTEKALKAIGPAAVTLAEAEGLDAHARSVAIRLNAR
ncbi:MAG: histidinol dehydrogenase [Alphaproteobacteria bacterium]|nr:histidinol dehydrogenase [Alphaproteobacteria bacterium]